jgi:mannose-6-phosphate isomerase-like protein (cupin superfamily)
MDPWYQGNVDADAGQNRSWLVGHFKDPGELRYDDDVEIKVSHHPAGQAREAWAARETRRTWVMVVAGGFEIDLVEERPGGRERTVRLGPGDYAMWERGVAHRYRAVEDTTMVTVRWPSVTVEEHADLRVPAGSY